MENKFEHLLSPIKIGNVVLRNRMHAAPGRPHFAQGPEPWPTDNIIAHWANKAKAGAAVVTCTGGMALGKPFSVRGRGTASMKGHFLNFDILDSQVQHYVSQLAEAIHFNGARASMMYSSGYL